MPKSINKISCPACSREISASAYMNHVKSSLDSHGWLIDEFEKIKLEAELNRKNCLGCSKELEFKEFSLNFAMLKFFGLDSAKTLAPSEYCSKKCAIPWNKNLDKSKNDILKRISEGRKGANNPIHKVLNNPEAKQAWKSAVKKAVTAFHDSGQSIKNKSFDEFYGEERAELIRKNQSEAAKKREKHGHTGKKHTEATKKLLAEKTIKILSERKNKVSKIQMELFEILKNHFSTQRVELEYGLGYYSVDIAFPEFKLAIEVDGDYYHVNEAKGYTAESKIQRRNLNNDAQKNKFYEYSGWICLRFWESEIKENVNFVVERIETVLCKN